MSNKSNYEYLLSDLTKLKGVGAKTTNLLKKKKINNIFDEKTDALLLKFNELTLTDEDTQSKIDERYLRMQVDLPASTDNLYVVTKENKFKGSLPILILTGKVPKYSPSP